MTYLLDSNIFIQAKNLHYGFDFCPAFWEWLLAENKNGNVFSVERVGDELSAGGDELASWANSQGSNLFLAPDQSVIPSLASVSNWIYSQNYEPAAVSTFLQVADYYLVAHAHAHEFTVVTHEVPADSQKKIKIPNPCMGLKIKCMNETQRYRITCSYSARSRFSPSIGSPAAIKTIMPSTVLAILRMIAALNIRHGCSPG